MKAWQWGQRATCHGGPITKVSTFSCLEPENTWPRVAKENLKCDEVQDLEMRDQLGRHGVCFRKAGSRRPRSDVRTESGLRVRDLKMLLVLKLEQRTISQGMQAPLAAGRGRKRILS